MKPTHKRKDKVFLDENTVAEDLQIYMDCRDGTVLEYGFHDASGYGSKHRAFYCTDSKSESSSLVIYNYSDIEKKWSLLHNICFDNDSWDIIKDLLDGSCTSVVRDF